MSNISKQESIYTGGNLWFDVLELEDGTCVSISMDVIRVFESRKAFDSFFHDGATPSGIEIFYDAGATDYHWQ